MQLDFVKIPYLIDLRKISFLLLIICRKNRYKKSYIDSLYSPTSRWYAELYKREVSENITFHTIIKISTIYEVSSGELIDFIISFDKTNLVSTVNKLVYRRYNE